MKTTIINPTATVKPVILGLILSLVGITVSLHGQVWQSYNGSFSGNWSDANHWSTGIVPVAGESVMFNFNSAPPATPATITLTADTARLSQFMLQGGSVSGTIPERDLTVDLAQNNLDIGYAFFSPYQGYREISKLTFVSTGGSGRIYNTANANGLQFYLFSPASGGAISDRPTESHVTFSTNTLATLWLTAVGGPSNTSAQVDGYLNAEANAQLNFSAWIDIGAKGGTSLNPVTGTVTVGDNATFTQAAGQTMTLGSVDGYSTGNLTISGGGTDVDLGAINWRNGTFTVELDSPTSFNPVNVIGNLTIADGVLLDVNPLAGASMPSEPLAIMTWGGTRTGEFTLSPGAAAGFWQLEYDDLTKTLFISMSIIPEPSSVLLLVIGLTGLLRRRTGRKTK